MTWTSYSSKKIKCTTRGKNVNIENLPERRFRSRKTFGSKIKPSSSCKDVPRKQEIKKKRMWDDRWHISSSSNSDNRHSDKSRSSSIKDEKQRSDDSSNPVTKDDKKYVSERSDGVLVCSYALKFSDESNSEPNKNSQKSCESCFTRPTSPFNLTKVEDALKAFELEELSHNYSKEDSSCLSSKRQQIYSTFHEWNTQGCDLSSNSTDIHPPKLQKWKKKESACTEHYNHTQAIKSGNIQMDNYTLMHEYPNYSIESTMQSLPQHHMLHPKEMIPKTNEKESTLQNLQNISLYLSNDCQSRLNHQADAFKRHRKRRTEIFTKNGIEQIDLVELLSNAILENTLHSAMKEFDKILKESYDCHFSQSCFGKQCEN